jgi:hypothetical protein
MRMNQRKIWNMKRLQALHLKRKRSVILSFMVFSSHSIGIVEPTIWRGSRTSKNNSRSRTPPLL